MTRMPPEFRARPFAHRGLHDIEDGRPENSMAAFDAAIAGNYGIELDVQASSDGEAVVFHDDLMDRMTEKQGRINDFSVAQLRATDLKGGGTIYDLETILTRIGGRVPVLVEIKDQSGNFGQTDCKLERRVCDLVLASGFAENCAIMSFNPYSVIAAKVLAPNVLRGLISYKFRGEKFDHIDPEYRKGLVRLAMWKECGADFVSYSSNGVSSKPVATLRAKGVPVFSWTIRSQEKAEEVLEHCDQITFEKYLP